MIDTVKSVAKQVDVRQNKDFSSLFDTIIIDTEVIEPNFLIYTLAALFICRFGAYIKLREKLLQHEIISENTINEIIGITGTIQTVSKSHKMEQPSPTVKDSCSLDKLANQIDSALQ